ncbi:rhomboid family intramembrane serine protease [candidate division KSB1 bacterium]|nr:rhomboid family intramembrane serine protease [candidate division KSB1 bacterium]
MAQSQKTGSMVCPNCGKLISSNAKTCMHCGMKNPGRWNKNRFPGSLLGNFSDPILIIRNCCIILYLISLLIDVSALFRMRGILSFLSPSSEALYYLGMTGQSFIFVLGRFWTLITAIYLHGSILHILFNMLWLHQMGHMVNSLFGASRTFLIFTLAGIFGYVVSSIFSPHPTIGASGAIFGLFGALVFYGRHRGGSFGMAIFQQVGTWALVLFFMGLFMSGVNNWAHAGGFVGGYLSASFLGYQERGVETQSHRKAARHAAFITVMAFVIQVVVAL